MEKVTDGNSRAREICPRVALGGLLIRRSNLTVSIAPGEHYRGLYRVLSPLPLARNQVCWVRCYYLPLLFGLAYPWKSRFAGTAQK